MTEKIFRLSRGSGVWTLNNDKNGTTDLKEFRTHPEDGYVTPDDLTVKPGIGE